MTFLFRFDEIFFNGVAKSIIFELTASDLGAERALANYCAHIENIINNLVNSTIVGTYYLGSWGQAQIFNKEYHHPKKRRHETPVHNYILYIYIALVTPKHNTNPIITIHTKAKSGQ